jgi:ferredoxin/flavodoxin---NADP+ reductase
MSDRLGSAERPLRVAIVGSGPAGFYAADHLLRQEDVAVEVDVFDRLPTPFGLVRAGVAPDHPKIKSVIRVYEKTAARNGFRFFGNVQVGDHVSAAELAGRFHAVIHAYGASTDRHLGIPGEELAGSHAATSFVAWYNAHPDFADLEFDLSCERAVVIGNGNVATDVARMLALTRPELEETDTANHAIDPLADCGVREIVILGRRGPAQAAFTNPELRELGEMQDADVQVDPAEMELDDLSREYLESDEADITTRKNVEIFTEFSKRQPEGKRKRIVLRFLRSPVEIHGDGKVERVVVARNELYRDDSGAIRARDTGDRETIECGLVLRSIGYAGVGLEGVPFDERRAVIPNKGGRVTEPQGGEQVLGQYAVGWIKRGPSGVIGTNKKDAQETVDNLLEDTRAGRVPTPDLADDPSAIVELLAERTPDSVTYAGWEAIDRAERERGEPLGRPRVKFVRIGEMLEAARAGVPSSAGG